jgi:hypothetical protein
MILQLLIVTVAGWIHRQQQHVITYLKEENRVLKSKLPRGRLRLTDPERRASPPWLIRWAANSAKTLPPSPRPTPSCVGIHA